MDSSRPAGGSGRARVGVLLPVLAAAALAACVVAAGALRPAGREAPRQPAVVTGPAHSARHAGLRPPLPLGGTVDDAGATTSVLEVRRPMPVPAGTASGLARGEEWLGVRARTCASRSRPDDVGWYRFAALGPGGERYAGGSWDRSDWPQQRFPQGHLAAGHCGEGWLLIPLLRGNPIRVVELSDSVGRPLGQWQLDTGVAR